MIFCLGKPDFLRNEVDRNQASDLANVISAGILKRNPNKVIGNRVGTVSKLAMKTSNNMMAILIAIFLASVISIISALPFRGRESSVVAVILTFIILAMAGLVAQYWIMPFSPLIWGVSLTTILIISLLMATPSPHHRRIKGARGEEQKEVKAVASISGLMWTLIFLLSAAVLIGCFRAP